MTLSKCTPAENRPIMIQRLSPGQENPEIWKNLYPELIRCRPCCDEVWFSTGIGFPKLEVHQKNSGYMADCARDLRKHGIIPSLQIQTTIGHSDEINGSVGTEAKTWSGYVGVHGEQCKYVNCPRQPGFLQYMQEVCRIYAQWKPGSVWIDDDLRLSMHAPAKDPCGCYCHDCLAHFAKDEGHLYTREELVQAYKKDPELYKRWEAFGIRSLEQVVEVIVKTFQEISPETRFGLQHCMYPIRIDLMNALKKYSGRRVGSRPGGGTYSDHDAYSILNKTQFLSIQLDLQQGYETIDQICAEIESCPRLFTCKTSHGHRLESMLYLASGSDSLSYFVMYPGAESSQWYGENLLAPLAAEAECYRDYITHNVNTKLSGIGVPSPFETLAPIEELGLPLIGIPFAAASTEKNAMMLCGTAAESLPESELETIFQRGCILDGYAVEALQKRGLSHLISGITTDMLKVSASECYTEDPLNNGLWSKFHIPLIKKRFVFHVPESLNARILGEYRDHSGKVFGAASLIFEQPNGARCAVLGFEAFNIHYISSTRVNFLFRVADWVSGETLPLRPAEPVQCMFMPRTADDGNLRSIVIVNPTIGWQKPFEIKMKNIPEKAEFAEWCVPAEKPVTVKLTRNRNECSVTIPTIAPWGIGWLKIPQ